MSISSDQDGTIGGAQTFGDLYPAADLHDDLSVFLHRLRSVEINVKSARSQRLDDYLAVELESLEERLIFCIDEVNAVLRRINH